jgi:hypothetical protein
MLFPFFNRQEHKRHFQADCVGSRGIPPVARYYLKPQTPLQKAAMTVHTGAVPPSPSIHVIVSGL